MILHELSRFYKKSEKRINEFGVTMTEKHQFQILIVD
jgi:hypothetical protein